MAEATYANIQKVGLPTWSEADQTLAKALQKEVGSEEKGLSTELSKLGLPVTNPISGGSDDIGDISWTVPTITIRFPSNIPGLQGHHWSNAVAMATPIAHKGVTAGAKAEAMTILDFLLKPELMTEAKQYFAEQTAEMKYEPLIEADTPAPTYLNKEIMDQYRPEMKKYYYDPAKYDTYLEQLGITYPTVKED